MNDVHLAAEKIVQKYLAVHHEVADSADFSLAQSLALYGLLRLSEMSFGIDQAAAVDKKIATLLLTGPARPLQWPHQAMGAMAGAYRFYQGAYKLGDAAASPLRRIAEQLAAQAQPLPAGTMTVAALFSVCTTLAMAAVVLDRADLHDAAIDCFEAHRAHWPDAPGEPAAQTPAPTARDSGLLAAALVEILRYLPYNHPRRGALLARLRDLLGALAARQTPAGLWRHHLDNPDSPEETTGSALIAYALFSAASSGVQWITLSPETLEKTLAGLLSRVRLQGNFNIEGAAAGSLEEAAGGANPPVALNALAAFGPMMLAMAAYAWLQRGQAWQALRLTAHRYQAPPLEQVEAYFERVHATCELNHNADGSYYQGTSSDPDVTFDEIIKESRTTHPIPRDTAHCVLGYLDMYRHSPRDVYLQRARAGLDWLAKEQEPDGCFRLWTRKKEGQVPHHGSLFETGIAAAALVKGYEFFKDERYLAASARAAHWALNWPVDRNVNYNAFVIWHLAEHYRLTGDENLLERTIDKTRQAMLTPQQAGGGWVGHNAWIWYHGINIRAYAALYRVLPPRHPFRAELEPALRAALAYFLGLQMENGAVHPNPDNPDKPSHLMFEIMVGVTTALQALDEPALRDSLHGLAAYRISAESGDPDRLFNNEKGYWLYGCSPWYVYALGAYLGQVRVNPTNR